ncbi:hypothetical protein FJT64_004943 [Amphibalanus amphitrite]|uniref:Uncharacterized protein n=1 Tax=Amphibalanus amphitrite TaxID=1232801 RepID=A0A6A4W6F5_AMPAM|nr:hypothetical protein FJT64_004943 [Amphibalanus amphitrite]
MLYVHESDFFNSCHRVLILPLRNSEFPSSVCSVETDSPVTVRGCVPGQPLALVVGQQHASISPWALPAMSLRHTLPAFALLLLGLLISAAVLAAERLWRRSDSRSQQYRQRHQLAQRCPSVITSPELTPPPRHLTVGRDCHLAADDRTTAAPLFDWPVSSSAPVRYLSAGSGRPSSHSADSPVTDAEVPQHRVQVLVHRRLASAAGRGSAVGWTDAPGPGDVPSTVPDLHRDGA